MNIFNLGNLWRFLLHVKLLRLLHLFCSRPNSNSKSSGKENPCSVSTWEVAFFFSLNEDHGDLGMMEAFVIPYLALMNLEKGPWKLYMRKFHHLAVFPWYEQQWRSLLKRQGTIDFSRYMLLSESIFFEVTAEFFYIQDSFLIAL